MWAAAREMALSWEKQIINSNVNTRKQPWQKRKCLCWLRTDPWMNHFVCPRGQEQRGVYWYGKLVEKWHLTDWEEPHKRSWANLHFLQWKMTQKHLTENNSANGEVLSTQTWETTGVNVLMTARTAPKEIRQIKNSDFFLQISAALHLQHFTCNGQKCFNPPPSAQLHCD